MAHRVKTHHWIDGLLSFVEKEFDSLEQALAHAEEAICHNVKVYNDLGQVVHYDVKRHKQTEDGSYA